MACTGNLHRRFVSMRLEAILIYLVVLLTGCKRTSREAEPSFYYWKTVYAPTAKEAAALDSLHVKQLYVRLFDVALEQTSNKVLPQGIIQWKQKPTASRPVTPVIFITQEAIQSLDSSSMDSLAVRMARLSEKICHDISTTNEVQIDCDWTAGTRDRYFSLLRSLRFTPFLQNKVLSVTIRLHQVKFVSETGVPPADKGLLMAYNMGNLKSPDTNNSIIDLKELSKYTAGLDRYPLSLDVALPVFDWWVLFDGRKYKGLVYMHNSEWNKRSRMEITSDTAIEGYQFHKGQWLRHEQSDMTTIQAVARHLAARMPSDPIRVVLFHLDETNLDGFSLHELETIFNAFGYRPVGAGARKRH
jgi:hypothetical protein